MIYVTINSKGGVGKSTLANQILPTYLYLKNGEKNKVKLIEIDDENNDSKTISQSDILEPEVIHTSAIKMIDEVFIDDIDIVIDVGGNKTATIFLEEMKKLNELENVVWFIPVAQGYQDTANAYDMHTALKEELNVEDKNIIFVLSNSKGDELEWEYLYFFGNDFLKTPFAITRKVENPNYIVIENSDILNNAKSFGKTVFDIAQNKDDFKQLAKDAKQNKKDNLKRKYLFLNRVKNEAIAYNKALINTLYKRLDELVPSNTSLDTTTQTPKKK